MQACVLVRWLGSVRHWSRMQKPCGLPTGLKKFALFEGPWHRCLMGADGGHERAQKSSECAAIPLCI